MIEARNLTKRYGDFTAIQDLTFQVQPGEVVGFLGVNGAGKTTTLRILSCYMPASSGQATVAGFDVFKDSLRVREQIGYLPESVPLYPEMRVQEYLAFRARLKGVARARHRSELARVMDACKIADRARQTIGTLSRGYRQRVGLADALLGPPKLLILDEPTSGLDPLQRMEVRALMQDLKREHTVFLSTHILGEVESTCTRVIILHRGKLVPEAEVARLRGACQYEARIAGPMGRVLEALRRLDGVASAEPIPTEGSTEPPEPVEHTHVRIVPKAGVERDPRDELVKLAAEKAAEGWRLLELRRRIPTLEEVFAQATAEESDNKENAQA